ncbi:MAG: FG-GAP-like repeat-containing protein [candidate division WOR-3 bacterium]
MKKIFLLFIIVLNLKAVDFVLIDTFNDAPNSPYAPIKAGDLDNDGLAEVIFASDSFIPPKIVIYERKEGGGFSRVHIVPTAFPNPWVFRHFGIGDFDRDGKMDIFISYYNNNFIEHFDIIESQHINSYPDTVVWSDSLYIEGNSTIFYFYAEDLDGDGRKEIAIHKGDATDLLIYENEIDNSYALVLHKNYYNDTTFTPSTFVMGDLDMDGLPELILINTSHVYNCKVTFFEAIGNDSIMIIDTIRLNNVMGWPNYDAIFCGDVNNNGKPEVMIHGHTPRGGRWRDDIWLIEATGDNQYEIIWYDSIPNNPAYPDYGACSAAGDLTGDGIPEIVISMTTRVYVLQYIPGQGYTYIWQKNYAWNTGNIAAAVYDINGNGLNDMILSVQHQEENRVTYILERSPSVSEKYLKITPYFYVLPKITSDSLKISYFLKSSKSADFYIYNILGEKVYFKKIKKEGEFYLNLKRLKFAPGIYFLRILSPEFKKTEKIIFWRK